MILILVLLVYKNRLQGKREDSKIALKDEELAVHLEEGLDLKIVLDW